jgi:hypothetical protein
VLYHTICLIKEIVLNQKLLNDYCTITTSFLVADCAPRSSNALYVKLIGVAEAAALTVTVIVPLQLLAMVARDAVLTIAACPHAVLADTATPVPVALILAATTASPTPSIGTLVAVFGSLSFAVKFIEKTLVPVMAHALPEVIDPEVALL